MVKQGRFSVIWLNFKEVKGNGYQKMEDKINFIFQRLYDQYSYLLYSSTLSKKDKEVLQRVYKREGVDITLLCNGLRFLSEILCNTRLIRLD